jgi:hypothetical protein
VFQPPVVDLLENDNALFLQKTYLRAKIYWWRFPGMLAIKTIPLGAGHFLHIMDSTGHGLGTCSLVHLTVNRFMSIPSNKAAVVLFYNALHNYHTSIPQKVEYNWLSQTFHRCRTSFPFLCFCSVATAYRMK